ncbi:helix-turn-helix domain-containing protein [Magnetospirillum sp. XM-1]|uniref:helix-turn-helix domain-containing protein n=1 Tax=Magnetospirillum sp. XM-1 TaxID=1663591 RepID=UPI000A9E9FD1|nr:helix-turn-helix domain-containing protein [Magnetospirillum sp. XM-1]
MMELIIYKADINKLRAHNTVKFSPQLDDVSFSNIIAMLASSGLCSSGLTDAGLNEFHAMPHERRFEIISSGINIFMDWPDNLFDLLDRIQGIKHGADIDSKPCEIRREILSFRGMLVHSVRKPSGQHIQRAIIRWRDRHWPEISDITKRRRAEMPRDRREQLELKDAGEKVGIGPSAARKIGLQVGLTDEEATSVRSTLTERIGPKEAARKLGVSVKTIRNLAKSGIIQFDETMINDGRQNRTCSTYEIDLFAKKLCSLSISADSHTSTNNLHKISDALRLFSCDEWPANEIIRSIYEGQITLYSNCKTRPASLDHLYVDLSDARAALYNWIEKNNPGFISIKNAARLVNESRDKVLTQELNSSIISMIVRIGPRRYKLISI